MKDLILYVAQAVVDSPEAVEVTEEEAEDRVILRLKVADADKGKVIGREGRIVNSMRSLLRATAARKGYRASLEIVD